MYCVKGKVKNLYLEVSPVGSTGSSMYCVKGESEKALHGSESGYWRGCIHPRSAGFRGTQVPLMRAGAKPQSCRGFRRAPTVSGTGRAPLIASV